MVEWKIVEIKDICTGIYEGPHATPKESLTGGIYLGIPAISNDGHINFEVAKRISEEDLPFWTKRVTPQEDDIVFTNEATLNLYAIIPRGFHGCLGRRLGLIRLNKSLVNVRYLFYYFFSPEWRETISRNKVFGATVERILMTKFPHFPVKLPPLSVQNRIANILSALDDKIALNNRINHNLEEQAQVLFKSYFVDFEPFKHGQFIDSELGKIPRDWKTIRFKSLAEIQKNTLNPQKSPQSLFTLYSLPAYDNNKEPETLCGEDILSNKTIIDGKLVLVSKLNPRIKRIWPISVTANNTLCSTEFIAYKAVEENLHPFVWCYLNSESYYERIMSEVNGATGSHQRFHAEKTMEYLIPYNHIAASVFSQNVSPILESIIKNEQENRVLKAKRDLLLPKLLLGKLEYSDLISYL